MKINNADLLSAIEGPVALSTKRAALAELNSVKLSAVGGKLTVAGTNLDIYQESFVDCEGDLEPICVPGAKLRDVLQNFKGEVRLTWANGKIEFDGHISEDGKPTKIKISTLPADKFLATPAVEGNAVDIDCAELSAAIKVVSWAVSTDKSRSNLMGVNIEGNEIAASDGYKITIVSISMPKQPADLFIPSDAMPFAVRALSVDGAKLISSERHIIIEHTAERMWIKKPEVVAFPPYRRFFPEGIKRIGTVDGPAFKDTICAAASLYDQTFAYTRMEFTEGLCVVTQRSQDSDLYAEFAGTFEPFRIAINATFLVRAIAQFDGLVEIWGKDSFTPLILKGGNIETMILPLNWQE